MALLLYTLDRQHVRTGRRLRRRRPRGPDDDGEEARFLTLLAGLGRVIPVDGHPEVRDGGAAGRVAQLRRAGQVADEQHFVEVRHQTTSSRTLVSPSGGSGNFLE